MIINADPKAILEVAVAIRDAYNVISNETYALKNELIKFGSTLDDTAYSIISSKVKSLLEKIDSSQESVLVICKGLIEYAKIIDESQQDTTGILS